MMPKTSNSVDAKTFEEVGVMQYVICVHGPIIKGIQLEINVYHGGTN